MDGNCTLGTTLPEQRVLFFLPGGQCGVRETQGEQSHERALVTASSQGSVCLCSSHARHVPAGPTGKTKHLQVDPTGLRRGGGGL